MSYRNDWIASQSEIQYNKAQKLNVINLYSKMKDAVEIRLKGEQAQVFIETPVLEGQDYLTWLRMPFKTTFLSIVDQPFLFKNLNDLDGAFEVTRKAFESTSMIKGILIIEDTKKTLREVHIAAGVDSVLTTKENAHVDWDQQWDRVFYIIFFIPTKDNNYYFSSSILGITSENKLQISGNTEWQVKMTNFVVHIINFLSSPSVKLLKNSVSDNLQKARQKRGQNPLPGWYEITYRKLIHEYTSTKISEKKWEHSYRYDVRGHQKIFRKGVMAGRIVWCPPHHRGLKNELYKPKGYVVNVH